MGFSPKAQGRPIAGEEGGLDALHREGEVEAGVVFEPVEVLARGEDGGFGGEDDRAGERHGRLPFTCDNGKGML